MLTKQNVQLPLDLGCVLVLSFVLQSPTKAVYNARHWTVEREEEPPPSSSSKPQTTNVTTHTHTHTPYRTLTPGQAPHDGGSCLASPGTQLIRSVQQRTRQRSEGRRRLQGSAPSAQSHQVCEHPHRPVPGHRHHAQVPQRAQRGKVGASSGGVVLTVPRPSELSAHELLC